MPQIEPSVEISNRADFALLCNARGLGMAVEVGVETGVNARQFLDRWHGHFMLLIDHYPAGSPVGFSDRTCEMMIAIQALAHHHGRYHFIRGKSLEIAANYPRWFGMPRFVYLDAGHNYEDIRADIAAWWELVESDGILAGHDYCKAHPGVIRAVDEFAAARGLCVWLTHERHIKSWYVYKTEPQTLTGVSQDMPSETPNPCWGTRRR